MSHSSRLKLTWTIIYCCKWQPYFSIEPLSKTGYWLIVSHGWFHLQGLTGGVKNVSRVRITKLRILAYCGIRTRDPLFTKRARYHWATKTNVSLVDKASPGFTRAIFRNLSVPRVWCSKAKSRKYQGALEVKSRVKTWQVRGIWSQQLEH